MNLHRLRLQLLLTQKSPLMDRRYSAIYNTPLLDYGVPAVQQAAQVHVRTCPLHTHAPHVR